MTRSHRLAHGILWPLLALAVAAGIGLALALKPAAATPVRPAVAVMCQ